MKVRRTRSVLPAPKLKPRIGWAPWVRPWRGITSTCMMEEAMVMAPT